MGFSLSPTVTVTEFDKTLSVPGLATSIASAVGHFQWGPIEEVMLVDNEYTLISKVGEPNDSHYADWFPVANFLAYSNNLKLVRVARNATNILTDATFVDTTGTLTSALSTFTTWIQAGDQITISGATESTNDGVYVVESVTATTIVVVGGAFPTVDAVPGPAVITAGAFNAFVQMAAIPVNGDPITSVAIDQLPIFVKNLVDLEQIVTNVPSAPFYARCPGTYGNRLTVSAFNGAWAESTSPVQDPVGLENWLAWPYKNFFEFKPSGTEIHIVVTLDGDVVERFYANQDEASVSQLGGTDYWYELINRTSKYIFAVPPSQTTGISHQNSGSATAAYTGTLISGYDITPVNFTDTFELGANGAPSLGDYQQGWDLFLDAEIHDINFCLQAGGGAALGAYILDNISGTRLDCVSCMSPDESDVVGDPTPATTIAALRDPGGVFVNSSSYGVIDGNYKRQYDKYNDKYRWVPLNGDIAGLMARTDNSRDPWWSPAGLNRGHIKNVFQLAFNPSKAQRDELSKVGINPVVSFRGEGAVLYDDNTALTRPSAFREIGIRRMFITIEKAIATAAKYQLFEFNDEITRNAFLNLVTPYLRNVQGRRGLQAFRVVCDSTNNTGEVIDRQEFIADMYIKPNHSINEVKLNFIAVKSGVAFEEVILTAATN